MAVGDQKRNKQGDLSFFVSIDTILIAVKAVVML